MGIGVSKNDNSPLLSLCRERKELIRAAADCRYCLATAHLVYFQSLVDLGNALDRFVEEELVVIPDSSDDDSSSEDNFHLNIHCDDTDTDTDTDTALDSSTGCVHNESECCNGGKVSKARRWNQNSQCPEKPSVFEQPGFVPMTVEGLDLRNLYPGYSENENSVSWNAHTSVRGDDIRYDQHEDVFGTNVPVAATLETPPANSSTKKSNRFFDIPSSFGFFMEEQNEPGVSYSASPPLPSVSAWDFLDPFNTTDNACFGSYGQESDELEPSELREVREREGIPNLEDESNPSSVQGLSNQRKPKRVTEEGLAGGVTKQVTLKIDENSQKLKEREVTSEQISVEESSKKKMPKGKKKGEFVGTVAEEDRSKTDEPEQKFQENETKSNTVSQREISQGTSETLTPAISQDGDLVLKESLNLESEHGFTPEDDSSGLIGSPLTHSCGLKDLRNIVKEIKNLFETAFHNGKEVSVLLEAGRLPYHPLGAKFKEFSSRILGQVHPTTSSRVSTHTLFTAPNSRAVLTSKAIEAIGEESTKVKSGYLSSTIEKLYMWEQKLHEEVMVEEKLRIVYDKECKSLKKLDKRGAESSKIDTIQTSVKTLSSNINVAVRAVEAVSIRVHMLRDDELQFQLFEIIEGLMSMWKFLAKCHQKQFRAIAGHRSCVHITEAGAKKSSSLKATRKLEAEILKCSASFTNYITAQKTFVKLLNEWLLRHISHKPEETDANGETNPLSPTKLEAPSIFTACNEWYHVLEKVSETGASKAIQELASRFRVLQEMQVEESQNRLKTEQLSKELTKQMRNLHEHWRKDALTVKNSSESEAAAALTEGGMNAELVSLKKALEEQKEKHEEAVRELNDKVSECLQEGLVPVFEALQNFCIESFRAYKNISKPKQKS